MRDIDKAINILNENRYSKSDMARAVGVKRQQVLIWETQKLGIGKKYLVPVADYLSRISGRNISVDYLLRVKNNV